MAALLVTPAFGLGSRLLDLIQGAPWRPEVTSPSWSPDGQRVAFLLRLRGGEAGRPELHPYAVHVVSADGSDQRVLARNSLGWSPPTWSPDGRTLAYPNVRGDVQVVNADGSGRRRLARNGWSPTWSPAGGRLAFLSIPSSGRGGRRSTS